MKTIKILFVLTLGLALSSCMSKSALQNALEKNPEILTNAIEKNPKVILEALNNAARKAQQQQYEDKEKELTQEREEEFKNPKVATIDDSRSWGKKDAPITIVEYSDFQCPFCKRGHATVEEVIAKYGDNVRVIFKNLPLDFHPMAMPGAKYFEAVMNQSPEKAKKFYDYVFTNQEQMESKKEKLFEEAAKHAGADLAKVKKEMNSEAIQKRIAADMEEAKKYGFNGTPGFLVNGVSIKGAYPAEEFSKIIDRLLKK